MLDREWKRYFRSGFEAGGRFTVTVAGMLRDIRAASPQDRPAYAASFGGFVRNCRTHVRIVLTRALIGQLGITPTQHVASFVMKSLFGVAASTATLDWFFADSSRDASVKHMSQARLILAQRGDQIERFRGLYLWFCAELQRRIGRIRGRLKKNRLQPH
jgi:hypothetical protein